MATFRINQAEGNRMKLWKSFKAAHLKADTITSKKFTETQQH